MDAALLSSAVLLVAGLGVLLRYDSFARFIGSQIHFRDVGVFSENEAWVWERIVVVAGLALTLTGFLRLFGWS